MTPRKAWETILKADAKENGQWTPPVEWIIGDKEEAVNVINNLVAKATPMKGIIRRFDAFVCPKCNKESIIKGNFCLYCGQAKK